MEMTFDFSELGQRARRAAKALSQASTARKDEALKRMATALMAHQAEILAANEVDMASALESGTPAAMTDRLRLTPERIESMASGLTEIAAQLDPVGEEVARWTRPNGLQIAQVRIPLGVIGIIYEARPNVTADAAGLCLKSGNVVVLRGGSEAQHSNRAILSVLQDALIESDLPADCVMGFPTTDRTWITSMLHAEQYLDVIIPRGGESLIRYVTEHSRVPVIKHYKGVCHIYIDSHADLEKAKAIAFNAKVQRPGVCNAMETLLVNRAVASKFLPSFGEALGRAGVEVRGCAETRQHIGEAFEASDDDYHEEFLDLVLAIKVVGSTQEAIEHIEKFGSDHTECIVSENQDAVKMFLNEIQSSVVIANASTRFSDGGQMGLGAEIGISTSRLHAYGPMGVVDLTARKYVIRGDGQIRN